MNENIQSNDKTKFLDFDSSKVQVITLDQLAETKREKDSRGNPMLGIYHYDLISSIMQMCMEHHYKPEVYDMFAANNKDRYCPGVSVYEEDEKIYGEKAVKATTLRRVFANIRLTDFDDDENTTNLAISFHQRGIQVGFGNMVKICHNQCMLMPDYYASTYNDKGYSNESLTVESLLSTVGGWLDNAETGILKERNLISDMKHKVMSLNEINRHIGELTSIRVMSDAPSNSSIRINETYPLNNTQINEFTAKMLMLNESRIPITAWHFYNTATELYKATSMDIPNMLSQNRAMVKFIRENVMSEEAVIC